MYQWVAVVVSVNKTTTMDHPEVNHPCLNPCMQHSLWSHRQQTTISMIWNDTWKMIMENLNTLMRLEPWPGLWRLTVNQWIVMSTENPCFPSVMRFSMSWKRQELWSSMWRPPPLLNLIKAPQHHYPRTTMRNYLLPPMSMTRNISSSSNHPQISMKLMVHGDKESIQAATIQAMCLSIILTITTTHMHLPLQPSSQLWSRTKLCFSGTTKGASKSGLLSKMSLP